MHFHLVETTVFANTLPEDHKSRSSLSPNTSPKDNLKLIDGLRFGPQFNSR